MNNLAILSEVDAEYSHQVECLRFRHRKANDIYKLIVFICSFKSFYIFRRKMARINYVQIFWQRRIFVFHYIVADSCTHGNYVFVFFLIDILA